MKVDRSITGFLEGLQNAIAELDLFPGWRPREIQTVCGVDVSYRGDEAAAAAVLWSIREKKVLGVAKQQGEAFFPYIPGFLFLREAPLMISAVKQLTATPELVMVDGHGLAHPRGTGLAVFVGLILRKPTVGVAKSLLVGQVKSFKKGLGPITLQGKVVGFAIKPRVGPEYYMSSGYLVNSADLPRIITMLGRTYPEVLREAHRISKEAVAS